MTEWHLSKQGCGQNEEDASEPLYVYYNMHLYKYLLPEILASFKRRKQKISELSFRLKTLGKIIYRSIKKKQMSGKEQENSKKSKKEEKKKKNRISPLAIRRLMKPNIGHLKLLVDSLKKKKSNSE